MRGSCALKCGLSLLKFQNEKNRESSDWYTSYLTTVSTCFCDSEKGERETFSISPMYMPILLIVLLKRGPSSGNHLKENWEEKVIVESYVLIINCSYVGEIFGEKSYAWGAISRTGEPPLNFGNQEIIN